ncbi:MAG: MBL fold metallo-hydrolase, partial [Candidatus Thorarchaeota archaeon]
MTLVKISDRIFADTEGTNGGNFGAVVLDDEIVIIDSGMFHHITKEAREFLETEHQIPALKLLLTHYHADHVWGAQAFNPITMISSTQTSHLISEALKDSWSPAGINKRAEESKETHPNLWKASQTLSIVQPDLVFEKSLRIGANQEITIQHVDGHTLGSSIVIVEPEHVCFCGDIVFHKSFPYAGDPSCNPDIWISVLEELKNADYNMIVPGHGKL